MKKDIRRWCEEWHSCQSSKIHPHVRAPLTHRLSPSGHFRSLHVDLVGPLPPSEGMAYLFTTIDRFTRWPEATPLRDSKAKTCAQALIRHWISRFGLPEDITSDRGAQFTSSLWTELGQVLGVQLHTTTTYNPQANDMIERLHHQLKSSLKARITDPYWIDHLPLVLLGIHVAWCEEPGCSPGELVYGSGLRLPGEFVDHHNPSNTQPPEDFLRHLQCAMHTSLPTPAIHHSKPLSYIPPTRMQSKFVYVRVDSHKKPLQRPYDGPFCGISTSDKLFVLDINGRQEKVSVDLFMPTFIENRSLFVSPLLPPWTQKQHYLFLPITGQTMKLHP